MATITKIQPRPHTFRIDNILIDEYGEKIGAIGVAIYNALARFADRQTGICYPCIGTIAKKLKLGRTTVKKYLRILLNHGLIAISARLSEEGTPPPIAIESLTPHRNKLHCGGDNWRPCSPPSTVRLSSKGVGRQMTHPSI